MYGKTILKPAEPIMKFPPQFVLKSPMFYKEGRWLLNGYGQEPESEGGEIVTIPIDSGYYESENKFSFRDFILGFTSGIAFTFLLGAFIEVVRSVEQRKTEE